MENQVVHEISCWDCHQTYIGQKEKYQNAVRKEEDGTKRKVRKAIEIESRTNNLNTQDDTQSRLTTSALVLNRTKKKRILRTGAPQQDQFNDDNTIETNRLVRTNRYINDNRKRENWYFKLQP